ncbi:NmrA family NAD(P)-binding protein [Pedobacter paludis]|uniref:NAD-dependent dehydratase n=1 Tax=Pedobacter paludis TaxID=2203212 RepID=A0A317F646_9SPHI|nr:NmrA family NAD(P)-binding protein [Pedobacter paludis]PWS33863.1 NAD-dependent dehydratase [Pedobacter paludis]
MKVVLTGSLGNIGEPLVKELVENGHEVSVISSRASRATEIEALGAQALIGKMQDVAFLTWAFTGADVVYLMETMEAVGDMFDTAVDFNGAISQIGEHYKQAVAASGVKNVIHLSSISAHTNKGNGILLFHYNVEQSLRSLPEEVNIKFIRPVGFYTNLLSFIRNIKSKGLITSNYGGDQKEPWVSPLDIASVIAEEVDLPFEGRTVRYVASDEVSPNEIAHALGRAIGLPNLKWEVISDETLLRHWLGIGFNAQVANGFVEMQASQGTGQLYEDYYRNKPVLGKVKLEDFAQEFAKAYNVAEF